MWEPLHLQNYNKKNIKNLLNVNNHYLSLHKLQLVLILTPNNKDNIHKSSNKKMMVFACFDSCIKFSQVLRL